MVNVCYYGSFSIVQFLTVLYIIIFRTEYIRTECKLYRTYDFRSKWLLKHEDNTQKGGVCGVKRTRIPLLYGIPSVLSVTVIPSHQHPLPQQSFRQEDRPTNFPHANKPTCVTRMWNNAHVAKSPVLVVLTGLNLSYKRVVTCILRYRSPTLTAIPSLP